MSAICASISASASEASRRVSHFEFNFFFFMLLTLSGPVGQMLSKADFLARQPVTAKFNFKSPKAAFSFFFPAFLRCQYWLMAVVTRTSQLRSWICSSKSAVAKNLTLLAAGFANGLSSLAATNAGMSCAWQFSSQAACSAVSRAGNWPSNVKKRYCSVFVSRPFVYVGCSRNFKSTTAPGFIPAAGTKPATKPNL